MITVLILQGCAWSNLDRNMFGAYLAVKTVDILQTREIYNDDNFTERNSLMKHMSKDQATAFMVIEPMVIYGLAEVFPKYRSGIIFIPLVITSLCVLNNFSIGVQF